MIDAPLDLEALKQQAELDEAHDRNGHCLLAATTVLALIARCEAAEEQARRSLDAVLRSDAMIANARAGGFRDGIEAAAKKCNVIFNCAPYPPNRHHDYEVGWEHGAEACERAIRALAAGGGKA